MKQTNKQRKSKVMQSTAETVIELHQAGLISDSTLNEFKDYIPDTLFNTEPVLKPVYKDPVVIFGIIAFLILGIGVFLV